MNKKVLLKEYYINLYPKDTDLPIKIWIDTGKAYLKGGHSYRMKFSYNDEWIPIMLPSMQIPETIESRLSIKKDILDSLHQFIELNIDLLMLAKEGIDSETLEKNIKPINDGNIEVVNNLEHEFDIKSKDQNGFRLVQDQNTKKYNFIDNQNKIVSKTWFDKTDGGFIKIGDIIIAFISIDNQWFKLFPNGELQILNNF